MTPKVSIIVPAYNVAAYIADCLNSILAQTYPNYETIVVDDGSTDATEAAVLPFLNSVRYVKQPHWGVSAARNTGIQLASGDVVAFLDADDLWLPSHLAESLAVFRRSPDAGLVHSDAYLWVDGTPLVLRDDYTQHSFHFRGIPVAGGPGRTLLVDVLENRRFLGPISTFVVARSIFDRVGLFDESLRYAEDLHFLVRVLLENFEVCSTSRPSVIRRLRPDALTKSPAPARVMGVYHALKKIIDGYSLTHRERLALARLMGRKLRWLAMEEAQSRNYDRSRELLAWAVQLNRRDVRNTLALAGMIISPPWTVRVARGVRRMRRWLVDLRPSITRRRTTDKGG